MSPAGPPGEWIFLNGRRKVEVTEAQIEETKSELEAERRSTSELLELLWGSERTDLL